MLLPISSSSSPYVLQLQQFHFDVVGGLPCAPDMAFLAFTPSKDSPSSVSDADSSGVLSSRTALPTISMMTIIVAVETLEYLVERYPNDRYAKKATTDLAAASSP